MPGTVLGDTAVKWTDEVSALRSTCSSGGNIKNKLIIISGNALCGKRYSGNKKTERD